jgi:hypothetical protein
MKKLILVSAAAMAALVFAPQVNAQIISVQFTSNAAGSIDTLGQTAGLVPETVWNTDNSVQPYFTPTVTGLSSLLDSNGNATGISESKTGVAYYGPNSANTGFLVNSAGNNNLYTNGIFVDYASSTPMLTLNGLTPTDVYTLDVYVRSTQPFTSGGTFEAAQSDSLQTFYFTTLANSAAFIPAVGLTAGTAAPANVIQFTGLTGSSSLIADIDDGSFGGITLDGFQLVDDTNLPATPEPSTVWMFSLGFLGLMVHVYRKRCARS